MKHEETFFIMDGDKSKLLNICFMANGIPTDVVFCDYSDKHFMIISQYRKPGTFVSVTKGNVNVSGSVVEGVYEVKTISGYDNEDYHLAARYIAEQLNIFKPILFSISLKDCSLNMLKAIVKVMKDNPTFKL